ncbi:MAG: right-handed parallel beta-helix repeat-containing protein, partial [Candidatus Kerfeldbacteria bacterium]|nr:right-handed parallel beta-helix repeat-containing protein [Candidatus Kerfeldbacteria bacterium]
FRVQYVNSGVAVRAGASSTATNNWVDRVQIRFTNSGVSVGEQYGTGNRVHGTVVQDSDIVDTDEQQTWPWAAVKQNDVESTGIVLAGGSGTILRRNTVRDVFNGIDGTISWALTDTSYNTDTDVADNMVTDVGDDGIELDGAATNLRVFRNTVASTHGVESSNATISAAPISVGPAWLIRNVLLDPQQYGVKASYNASVSAGRIFVFHNTFYGSHGDLFGLLRYTQSNNQTGFTTVYRNNLVVVGGTQTTANGIGFLFQDAATDHATPPVTFDLDYNGYFSSRTCTTSCRLFNWLSVDYSNLAAFAAASGHEAHGRWVNPSFVDAGGGNFALQSGSGVIDQGIALPGINDGYSGSAPDLGAFEFTADVTPPAAVTDLRAS